MARNFRVYQKKRGSRRTGSQRLGRLWEAAFFAVCFLLGCGGLVVMVATVVVPEWRANHQFIPHRCVVLDTRVVQQQGDGGTSYRPEIKVEYRVEGETYRPWAYDLHGEYFSDVGDAEQILRRFTRDTGRQYVCWYDPSDPNVVVLVRRFSWWTWLTLVVPLCFVLIGGGGLIYQTVAWGKSAERRADMARRAAGLELFEDNGRSRSEYPNVPAAARVTDSPGTTLAFRLPAATRSAWAICVTLLACLLWNGMVSAFVVRAVRGHIEGEPDWFLTVFVIPFGFIGIGLIGLLIRQLLVTTGIGPTLVEISGQPVYPGERYELFLSQTGRLKMKSLEVLLVCDEEATFRHGTDTRRESRRVYQQRIARHEGFRIRQGLPFETKCQIAVPAGAMHSFAASHNEVNWKVLVKGSVSGWPDFERWFPVVVYPGPNGRNNE